MTKTTRTNNIIVKLQDNKKLITEMEGSKSFKKLHYATINNVSYSHFL